MNVINLFNFVFLLEASSLQLNCSQILYTNVPSVCYLVLSSPVNSSLLLSLDFGNQTVVTRTVSSSSVVALSMQYTVQGNYTVSVSSPTGFLNINPIVIGNKIFFIKS
jgi:hypothetical protein